jgi:gentisate 1,2-dioxygenase
MSKPAMDHRDRLDALNAKLSNLDMRGYWQLRHDSERMEPKLWRWADIYPALMETADVVRIGADAFRRNVSLQTGSRTITMGFQIVLPGEIAPPHRHTNTALRFVVKGGGAYTTSNGEPMNWAFPIRRRESSPAPREVVREG